ncbi:preprotein translocase subunit YidC [Desulforamulus profundi]|uniref:Preprotein translocase subunit YidC n=1 Tax=Desulforamulus profundi TaxID=1383067 RepID=A0A2C6MBJ7_9FIRM|nr:YidC/Oxa1 family membrane protein insertase [Desulforamulus profundi]PHJ38589.1 preprotein translocase subunit YidC [Desulforamulus profundi]
MLDFIAIPMGAILKYIYDNIAFQNYGIAIILFTVGIKSLMLPLTIKQVQSTSKIGELQPQMQEIQKKYKDDKEKQSTELMKLYQENKVNPTGGCLPLLIQIPILFSLYYVISQPLKYMAGKSPEIIARLYELIPQGAEKIENMKDLSIIAYFSDHSEQLQAVSHLLKPEDLLNMNFLGINLGAVPAWNTGNYINSGTSIHSYLLLLIPLLSALTSYISVKYSMKDAPKTNEAQMQTSIQNNMALVSTVMSGVIAFTVPAGLGLYWIAGNVYQIAQQMFINRFVMKKHTDGRKKKSKINSANHARHMSLK